MSDYTKSLLKAIGVRAAKTFIQCLVSAIGVDATAVISSGLGIMDVNWVAVLSTALLATFISLMMNCKGVPEVEDLTGGGKITVTKEAGDEENE